MRKPSTAAWVAHNLGRAIAFGGTLFGKRALNPSVKAISSKPKGGKVLSSAWNRYNALNAFSLGTAAATWFVGRAGISGRSTDEQARSLVLIKDVFWGAASLAGLASVIGELLLSRQAPEGATPTETGNVPAPETHEQRAGQRDPRAPVGRHGGDDRALDEGGRVHALERRLPPSAVGRDERIRWLSGA